MKAADTQFIKKNFKLSLIEESAHGASYSLIPHNSPKKFVQVLSFQMKADGFVNIQIFVSNLSATEMWAEIDIDFEFVNVYLKKMISISNQELAKSIKSDAQFEALMIQIEKSESKQSSLLEKLSAIEVQLDATKTPEAKQTKLAKEWSKLEETCLNEEIHTSELTFRYFVNTLEEIDPFFYSRLFSVEWALKKAKTAKKTKK